jgi:D-lactate dehydrogenase (cytochrome)
MEFKTVLPSYQAYLRDESRLTGKADYICFPENTDEAALAIRRANSEGLFLTFQGNRTGISGGAVPGGGLILSTEKMNRVLGCGIDPGGRPVLRVQAGMNFADLGAFLNRGMGGPDWTNESIGCFAELNKKEKYRFTPNPTESSASLGGAFACNARGPNSLRFGGTAAHVAELAWLTPRGERWNIKRGDFKFDTAGCTLPDGSRLMADTSLRRGASVLLHPLPGLDLVDFLAGSEGLTGMAGELALYIEPIPAASWVVVFFFTATEPALDFSRALSRWKESSDAGQFLSAAEYYDSASLELVRGGASQGSSLRQLPPINPEFRGAVHVELEGEDSEQLEAALMEQLTIFTQSGGKEENTWAAADSAGAAKYRILRHSVPELINIEIDRIRQNLPSFHKIASDSMVPPGRIFDWNNRYHRDMAEARLRGFVFGHILEGRLHVNLLAENADAFHRCRNLMETWAADAAAEDGILAAENGAGRLKGTLVSRFLSGERLAQIRLILEQLDGDAVLGGLGRSGQAL